ncbi:hypothetical protein Tco_0474229 [Tanacetum coccineum]
MTATQAVQYAPKCGDMTVESVQFLSNNFVGNFSYPQSVPAYKEICKFLMNCSLAEAFTKTPSVLYQNFLIEFWCTAVVEDPRPPTDDSEARPLKEFIIKFTVMNDKRPLTLDFKTFCESTGLDYNQGKYGAYPYPKFVMDELKGKKKSQTVSQPKPMIQGPEASGALPQKRKKPKSKKTSLQTPVTPPNKKVPMEDYDKTQSVSSGQTAHPQDTEGHI